MKIRGISIKYFFMPSRWRMFISWLLKKVVRWLDKTELPILEQHEMEQFAVRLASCYDCVENGKCLECGCDTIGAMNTMQAQCSAEPPKWSNWCTKEEWNEFKKQYRILFKVTYLRRNGGV